MVDRAVAAEKMGLMHAAIGHESRRNPQAVQRPSDDRDVMKCARIESVLNDEHRGMVMYPPRRRFSLSFASSASFFQFQQSEICAYLSDDIPRWQGM